MALSHSFKLAKSICSYHVVLPDRLILLGASGSITSGGEFFSGSGVKPKCDSKRYEGIRVSSLDASKMVPVIGMSLSHVNSPKISEQTCRLGPVDCIADGQTAQYVIFCRRGR